MSELGRILVEARTAKELSLADVEKATRIRQKYLEAFEQGDYASLPRGAVARGFLRTYATYLGLDADDALQRYSQESGDTDEQTPIAEVGKPRLVDYRPVEVELLDTRPNLGWVRWVVALVIVAALAAAAWWFLGRDGGTDFLGDRGAGVGAGAHVDQYPLGHAHPLDRHGHPDLAIFSRRRDRHADLRSAAVAHADRPADDHADTAAHCNARSGGADRAHSTRRPASLGARDRRRRGRPGRDVGARPDAKLGGQQLAQDAHGKRRRRRSHPQRRRDGQDGQCRSGDRTLLGRRTGPGERASAHYGHRYASADACTDPNTDTHAHASGMMRSVAGCRFKVTGREFNLQP